MMHNYIPDQNPFKLAGPPRWWLQRLWDFDASLVVVPSRQTCCYRLGQRRPLRLPEQVVNEALWQDSDTQMMARHGLIPVTTIIATANWSNPLMFQELAARAPWRQGGAEKVIREMEGREAAEEQARAQHIDEVNTHYAKDAWRFYLKKLGVGRTFHGAAAPLPKHS